MNKVDFGLEYEERQEPIQYDVIEGRGSITANDE